ncbi:hypothetical protein [Streptosporangium sp. NPDC048865]|uniref:hypothetical protein n=1 Tax=Streptosporangium sp. NPDC048865 TaxID=3155766 RepID=UPI003420E24B
MRVNYPCCNGDLGPAPGPARALGSAGLRAQWFAQALLLIFADGLTGEHVSFGAAQHAALSMPAERHGRDLAAEDTAGIVDRIIALGTV